MRKTFIKLYTANGAQYCVNKAENGNFYGWSVIGDEPCTPVMIVTEAGIEKGGVIIRLDDASALPAECFNTCVSWEIDSEYQRAVVTVSASQRQFRHVGGIKFGNSIMLTLLKPVNSKEVF